MDQLTVVLVTVGATALIVGIFSEALKKTPLQEPLIGVAVGLAIGPYGFDWLEVDTWPMQDLLIEQLARLTLGIGLMATALRISAEDLRRLWRPVSLLLTAGMLGMWAASSASAAWALGLPLSLAALIGAVLTPTDPVVASSIVTGRFARGHLPQRIRGSLSLESGANDGLAHLFVMLPILVLNPLSPSSWGEWIVESLLRGVLLAVVLGAVIGYAAGRVLHFAHHGGLIESYSFLTFTTTLSLFTLGVGALIGTEALIAVFVAGVVFTLTTDTGERHEEEQVQEAMSKLFTLPMFIVFGSVLPIAAWARHGPALAAFIGAVIIARRLPILAVLYPGLRHAYAVRDALYLGWFGPIGVAAIYYAASAVAQTGQTTVWEVASAAIFASILAHGVTAAPLSRLYARRERTAQRGGSSTPP